MVVIGWWTRFGLITCHVVLLGAIFLLRGTASDSASCWGFFWLLLVLFFYQRAIGNPGFVTKEFSSGLVGEAATHSHCSICEMDVPLRSKHCKKCGYCVERYGALALPSPRLRGPRLTQVSMITVDHHCTILAACVGARNHPQFVDYLVFQSILCLHWVWIVFIELVFDAVLSVLWGVPCVLVLLGCAAIPVVLLIQHIFLILTNQTSWEFYRRERISYLANLDEEILPFDEGILRNIRVFCCLIRCGASPDWKLPPPRIIKKKKKGTCWNNKYYSCC